MIPELAPKQPALQVYFDGACPVCSREAATLRRLDRAGQIHWVDIAAPDFEAAGLGKSNGEFDARIQGRLPDGTWVEGVEVFRRIYSLLGYGPLVSISRLPGIDWALDRGYAVFARNRVRWFGRCDPAGGSCRVRP